MILLKSDGYTITEVIVTLLIISIISTILFSNSSKIEDVIFKSKNELNIKIEEIKLINILNQEVQNIQQPWFLDDYLVEEKNNSIEFFYYKGIKESSLLLDFKDKVSIIIDGRKIYESKKLVATFNFNDGFINMKTDKKYKFLLGVQIA